MFQMAGKPTKQWSSVLLSVSEKWKSEESRMRLASNTPNGPCRKPACSNVSAGTNTYVI
jgi:hypothetical protein